jgi:hypothetical protein
VEEDDDDDDDDDEDEDGDDEREDDPQAETKNYKEDDDDEDGNDDRRNPKSDNEDEESSNENDDDDGQPGQDDDRLDGAPVATVLFNSKDKKRGPSDDGSKSSNALTTDHSAVMNDAAKKVTRDDIRICVKEKIFKTIKFLPGDNFLEWDYPDFGKKLMDRLGIEKTETVRKLWWKDNVDTAKKAMAEKRASLNQTVKAVVMGKFEITFQVLCFQT